METFCNLPFCIHGDKRFEQAQTNLRKYNVKKATGKHYRALLQKRDRLADWVAACEYSVFVRLNLLEHGSSSANLQENISIRLQDSSGISPYKDKAKTHFWRLRFIYTCQTDDLRANMARIPQIQCRDFQLYLIHQGHVEPLAIIQHSKIGSPRVTCRAASKPTASQCCSLCWSMCCKRKTVFQFLAVPTVFSLRSIKFPESFERPIPSG